MGIQPTSAHTTMTTVTFVLSTLLSMNREVMQRLPKVRLLLAMPLLFGWTRSEETRLT